MNLDKEANTDHPKIGIVRVYLECIRLKYVCSKHVHSKYVFEIRTQNARCLGSGHSMYGNTFYFSTTSRISIGHALAQMPQAMHLEAVGASSTFTSTPNGHASLHLPQPTQSFLLIV